MAFEDTGRRSSSSPTLARSKLALGIFFRAFPGLLLDCSCSACLAAFSCTDMHNRFTAAAHSGPTALAIGLGGRWLGFACRSGTHATSSAESELWPPDSACNPMYLDSDNWRTRPVTDSYGPRWLHEKQATILQGHASKFLMSVRRYANLRKMAGNECHLAASLTEPAS